MEPNVIKEIVVTPDMFRAHKSLLSRDTSAKINEENVYEAIGGRTATTEASTDRLSRGYSSGLLSR